ncbi:hypothetical protein [Pseudomonas sp. BEA3.1]|uniref:hypothetical protein n=1 Tax=Pseudomonas sp. BEA3.1 TaxID=3083251 RepID=UPI002964DEE3|nr:hypothetical protein [Pseudomonas sp. BEA3.1]MDW2777434.1 hypothetical protein [Pseudomonas sp. BEA3.1]
MTSTIAPSTGQDDDDRARLLASTPDLLRRTNDLLDRLQALEAAQPDPARARAARSDRIEALILEALDNTTLRAAVLAATPCYRVGKVWDHLNHYREERYHITKPPCRKKIREVLQDHDYL